MKPPRASSKTLSPNTTAEENLQTAGLRGAAALTSHGQRKINLIWETTQGVIAIMVTMAVIAAELLGMGSVALGNAFTLIIAIYFVRMNHTKVGGVADEKRRGE
jgi:hypothetical protein